MTLQHNRAYRFKVGAALKQWFGSKEKVTAATRSFTIALSNSGISSDSIQKLRKALIGENGPKLNKAASENPTGKELKDFYCEAGIKGEEQEKVTNFLKKVNGAVEGLGLDRRNAVNDTCADINQRHINWILALAMGINSFYLDRAVNRTNIDPSVSPGLAFSHLTSPASEVASGGVSMGAIVPIESAGKPKITSNNNPEN
jgi:hypothetical protein